ncbi:MAG: phage tail tape measure protein, partial [Dehalococcoidales bacterium]
MAVISDLIARLGLDPRDFNKKLKGAERRLAKTASKFKELGRTLTVGVTAPLAGIGILATKQFADFDDALRKSAAILTGAQGKMKELEEAAREVGRTSTFSATQAAEAFFFLASAGLDAEESIKALGTVATFAEAGSFDLATATDLLTDAQSAMGLSVENSAESLKNLIRVSDVLVGANTLANASTREFSVALTSGAAVAARNAGLELEETVGILAVYATQGIKGADASTKLRIALRDLVTKAEKNEAAFKKLGINVFDASDNLLSMS